jgi:hypothetical protein
VEDVLRQRISPLDLVGARCPGFNAADEVMNSSLLDSVVAAAGWTGSELVPVGDCHMAGSVDIAFPVVPGGISVRPLLKTEDLNLIRRAMVVYIKHGCGLDGGRCQWLMSRMLRKAMLKKEDGVCGSGDGRQ